MNSRNILFFCAALLAAAAPFSSAHASARNSYFDVSSNRSGDLSMFPKWNKMVLRFAGQKKLPDHPCNDTRYHPCAIKDWHALIDSMHDKPLSEQLAKINSWANAHPYIIDQINWGVGDYWETPHEFISVSGDCEDYAIAKYYSLQALGVPEEKLRIIIVQDFNLGGIIHAILGVYDDHDDLLLLDNQIKQVIPALNVYHYKPIYSINKDSWWAYQ